MKNTKNNSKKVSKRSMVAVGAGVAALGAGAYYLLGPKSKEHQKKAKALLSKMEKEAMAKFKQAKDVSEPVYKKTVDALATHYAKQYKAYEKDIEALAKKLKGGYKKVAKKVK